MICYKLVFILTSVEKQRKKRRRRLQNWINDLTDWFWILCHSKSSVEASYVCLHKTSLWRLIEIVGTESGHGKMFKGSAEALACLC